MATPSTPACDRNFDDLAERFEKRIHFSNKGELRRAVIWRDINEHIAMPPSQTLTILDIGGGLGDFSIAFAKQGHTVVYNDLSLNMMSKAQARAEEAGVLKNIVWSNQSFQDFAQDNTRQFDLVLCHALLEWLAHPDKAITLIRSLISPTGFLSLCFYNLAGLIYRNLICGNFRHLGNLDKTASDEGSLTPSNPCEFDTVIQWLKEEKLSIAHVSGIRVFSDYVLQKRGGNLSEQAVLKQELLYSTQEPFKRLGRYCHLIASTQGSI